MFPFDRLKDFAFSSFCFSIFDRTIVQVWIKAEHTQMYKETYTSSDNILFSSTNK